jgi:hypothetical protein
MKGKKFWQTAFPHVLSVILFVLISYLFFFPMLQGKVLQQNDKNTFLGTSKEIRDYREKTGEEALWTNSQFGGMPSYLISTKHPGNLVKKVDNLLQFAKRPASQLFILLLGGYLALLLFGLSPWLSLLGALALGFSSYNIIILEAGHNTKAIAIAYMPPIIAGIYHAFHKKRWLGAAVAGLFLGVQLAANHLQITYYTLLIVLVMGFVELIQAYKQKSFSPFFKTIGILLIAVILAVGANFSKLWTTYEYGKYSIRGASELTHDKDNKTSGLDKDYATDWSYGIDETLTLLIPNFKGGASYGSFDKDSETYEFIKQAQGTGYANQIVNQLPGYWGTQPFTSGPVYLGAILIFLFVLGIFILRGPVKWWLIAATVLGVTLSWGDNMMWLTNFFLEYVPGYNKFRTVSMTLVIAQFTIPVMGLLALQKVLSGKVEKTIAIKYVKYSLYIVGGICLLFGLMPGMFYNFLSPQEDPSVSPIYEYLIEDRQQMLRADALRSLIFITLSAVVLLAFLTKRLKSMQAIYILLALVLVDLWAVDKRYLNEENFVPKRQAQQPYQMTRANQQILADTDPNFRVFNAAANTFNDASTSYFHSSIGGYHGAKMRRYQELITYQIAKNNMQVLNMLNTKYFIVPTEKQGPVAQANPGALGNAWFVNKVEWVPDADAEMAALDDFSPATTAIVDERFAEEIQKTKFTPDSTDFITLEKYSPNQLKYRYQASAKRVAIFSEIYYPKGWTAKVDGEEAPIFRANYVLRGMEVPAGNHTITFTFHPRSYFVGNKISLASSILLLLLVTAILGKEFLQFYKRE